MQKVIPFIWFENQALNAAKFYAGIFPDSKMGDTITFPGTPSGDAQIVSLNLLGRDFQFMNAGEYADRNPSFSYMVACDTVEEVDRLYNALVQDLRQNIQGASEPHTLLELGEYPFSKRFAWLEDSFGVSWQVMYVDKNSGENIKDAQRITPCMLFVGDAAGKAEEAMNLYTSIFENSSIMHVSRHSGSDSEFSPGEVAGTIEVGRFTLEGMQFVVMDSSIEHKFGFNAMQSLLVNCKNQAEVDRFWDKLSAVPEAEQSGWLKDKFGISWQINSERLDELMAKGSEKQRAAMVQAFMPMKKLDIAKIEKAYTEAE